MLGQLKAGGGGASAQSPDRDRQEGDVDSEAPGDAVATSGEGGGDGSAGNDFGATQRRDDPAAANTSENNPQSDNNDSSENAAGAAPDSPQSPQPAGFEAPPAFQTAALNPAAAALSPLADPLPPASYRVVYWVEKPGLGHDPQPGTLADYSYGHAETKTGTTDETVSVTTLPEYSPFGIDDPIRYAELQRGDSATIEEDGSTVLNVYCKLKSYTVTFDLAKEGLYFRLPGETGTAYGQGQNAGNYQITVKYGQDVSEIWPSSTIAYFPDWSELNSVSSDNGAQSSYNGWASDADNDTTSFIRTHIYTMTGAYMPKDPSVSEYTYTRGTGKTNLAYGIIHARFYVETLPGEDTTGKTTLTWNNKTYVLMPEYSQDGVQVVFSNEIWIPGLKPEPDITAYYDNGSVAKGFQGVLWSQTDDTASVSTVRSNNPWWEHLLFTYDSFKFTYDTQGFGTAPTVASPVKYKSSLNGLARATPLTAPTAAPAGYQFAGWYTDAACTTPFIFSSTMPAHNVTVFAKWDKPAVSAASQNIVVYKGIPQTLTLTASVPNGQQLSGVVPEVSINNVSLSSAPFAVDVVVEGGGQTSYIPLTEWASGGFLLSSAPLKLRVTALQSATPAHYPYTIRLKSGGSLIAKCGGTITVPGLSLSTPNETIVAGASKTLSVGASAAPAPVEIEGATIGITGAATTALTATVNGQPLSAWLDYANSGGLKLTGSLTIPLTLSVPAGTPVGNYSYTVSVYKAGVTLAQSTGIIAVSALPPAAPPGSATPGTSSPPPAAATPIAPDAPSAPGASVAPLATTATTPAPAAAAAIGQPAAPDAGETTTIRNVPTPLAAASPQTTDDEELETIADAQTPLAAIESAGQWSVLNLLLGAAAALFALVFVIRLLSGRRRDEERSGAAATSAAGLVWGGAVVVLGLAAIVAFLLTEDLTLPLSLADAWSPLMAAFIAAQLVLAVVFWRLRKPASQTAGQPGQKASFATQG
ncbi:MAG: InlB B-repeat-containing protein [Coriobacteriales bacterium]|nr:InlB B-repeat-containing protein [Coriobacteriales bacterium]